MTIRAFAWPLLFKSNWICNDSMCEVISKVPYQAAGTQAGTSGEYNNFKDNERRKRMYIEERGKKYKKKQRGEQGGGE